MAEAAFLHCPIRGDLAVSQRAADNLTFTEEKHRIDAIRYLLQRQYPKDNFGIERMLFRIGNAGRNSFRTDFAVYDQPFDNLRGLKVERRIEHIKLLAEIKRDNDEAERTKAVQVRSALSLVPDLESLGVYWDDVEQRFFYRSIEDKRTKIYEAPISKIPEWGQRVESTQLLISDLSPTRDLVKVFDEIEDILHPQIADKSERYTIIQQLLLMKIHDENRHKGLKKAKSPLGFQDFTSQALANDEIRRRLNGLLAQAASHYNQYLPQDKRIDAEFHCSVEALRNATKILAPINILDSKANVIQSFYMKFAKNLYKWDLAQYFTPNEVIDFIVEVINPQPGEHVHDPACGSADFLVSAFRFAGPTEENCVWGADNSKQAVQVSILNMVLNGDGKTQIIHQDSLASYGRSSKQYPIVLCNPPFGTKILERREEVLRKFDLGYTWLTGEEGIDKTDQPKPTQQTGILFAELCVRLSAASGRIGIILPNGYLGNKGAEYVALREWLLRHAKIIAIVAFPRFTFKKSGADVSASVLFLEARKTPLLKSTEGRGYRFYVGNIESVGWRAGDKTAAPVFQRNPNDGSLILDEQNEPILDADFDKVLEELLHSPAADFAPWLIEDRSPSPGAQFEGIRIENVLESDLLIMDPKRFSSKFLALQTSIKSKPHFKIRDVLEAKAPSKKKIAASSIYKYVEIENIGAGDFDFEERRGWELPQRARLFAEPRDFFIAHLWSSAGKWFVASGDCANLIVTNGCAHLQVIEGGVHLLADLVVGLCSEAFAVQIRGLATGSDGLAEISDNDLLSIVLPRLSEKDREQAKPRLKEVLAGVSRFSKFADSIVEKSEAYPRISSRKSHGSLV